MSILFGRIRKVGNSPTHTFGPVAFNCAGSLVDRKTDAADRCSGRKMTRGIRPFLHFGEKNWDAIPLPVGIEAELLGPPG